MTCLIQMIPGNLENIYFVSIYNAISCRMYHYFMCTKKRKEKKQLNHDTKLLNQLNYKMDPTFSNVKMFFF